MRINRVLKRDDYMTLITSDTDFTGYLLTLDGIIEPTNISVDTLCTKMLFKFKQDVTYIHHLYLKLLKDETEKRKVDIIITNNTTSNNPNRKTTRLDPLELNTQLRHFRWEFPLNIYLPKEFVVIVGVTQ
jgi:hypothetical protein